MPTTRLPRQTDLRRLMVLWGILTGVYLAGILFRLIRLRQPVGLPTYAGCSAIAGVWFALLDFVRRQDAVWFAVWFGAITSLLISVTINTTIISQSAMTLGVIPPGRSFFTLLLIIALLSTARHRHVRFNNKDKE